MQDFVLRCYRPLRVSADVLIFHAVGGSMFQKIAGAMNLEQASPLAPLVSAVQRRSVGNAVLCLMHYCLFTTLFPFSAATNEGDAVQNKVYIQRRFVFAL